MIGKYFTNSFKFTEFFQFHNKTTLKKSAAHYREQRFHNPTQTNKSLTSQLNPAISRGLEIFINYHLPT